MQLGPLRFLFSGTQHEKLYFDIVWRILLQTECGIWNSERSLKDSKCFNLGNFAPKSALLNPSYSLSCCCHGWIKPEDSEERTCRSTSFGDMQPQRDQLSLVARMQSNCGNSPKRNRAEVYLQPDTRSSPCSSPCNGSRAWKPTAEPTGQGLKGAWAMQPGPARMSTQFDGGG